MRPGGEVPKLDQPPRYPVPVANGRNGPRAGMEYTGLEAVYSVQLPSLGQDARASEEFPKYRT